MDDMISRQAAIDGKISIQRANGVEIYTDEAVPVEHLKNVSAANVVPVVRCRNCAKLNRNGYCTRFQNNISGIATSWFMPDDDDFCSYGERKESAYEI